MKTKSLIAALACGLAFAGVHAAASQPAPASAVRADDGMVTFVKKRVRHTRTVKRTTHRRTTHTETHSSNAASAAK